MKFIEQPAVTQDADNFSVRPESKVLRGEPMSPLSKIAEAISPVKDFLSDLGNSFSSFWANPENQRLLLSLLLLGIAIFSLYILLVIFAAVNHLPVLPSFLKLIGMIYSIWFCWRYVIRSKNRQELMVKLEQIKVQIISSQSN